MGVPKASAEAPGPHDWHANLIRIGSKKLVLFCATETLYCCLTPVSSRQEIRDIQSLFRVALEATLVSDGFSQSTIDYCLERHEELGIGTTYDRSVLGSMKEHVLNLRYYIELGGGMDSYDPTEQATRMNDMPHVQRAYFNARTALQRSLIRGVA